MIRIPLQIRHKNDLASRWITEPGLLIYPTLSIGFQIPFGMRRAVPGFCVRKCAAKHEKDRVLLDKCIAAAKHTCTVVQQALLG